MYSKLVTSLDIQQLNYTWIRTWCPYWIRLVHCLLKSHTGTSVRSTLFLKRVRKMMAEFSKEGWTRSGVGQQTSHHDREDSIFARSYCRTIRQIWEHHKGNMYRDWLQKTAEIVEEGEWINKTVLSASPGPAGSIKWVDVGRWVTPFLLLPLFYSPFVFLSHPYGRFHFFPSPYPAPHSIEMASLPHTHTYIQTYACLHKHPTSLEPCLIYGSITADRPPGWTSSSTSSLSCAQMLFK